MTLHFFIFLFVITSFARGLIGTKFIEMTPLGFKMGLEYSAAQKHNHRKRYFLARGQAFSELITNLLIAVMAMKIIKICSVKRLGNSLLFDRERESQTAYTRQPDL